jgi:hypothetical protein
LVGMANTEPGLVSKVAPASIRRPCNLTENLQPSYRLSRLCALLCPFGQLPEFRARADTGKYYSPEFGMFWAIKPASQGRGYATEAARAMVDYAFEQLHVKRIVAMTEYTNAASQRVMRKIGMKLSQNPLPEPTWLQVVGLIENKRWVGAPVSLFRFYDR